MPKKYSFSKNNYYQIGLGSQFLARSRFVFLVLIALTLLSSILVVVVGVRNGEWRKRVVDPVNNIVSALEELSKPSDPSLYSIGPLPTVALTSPTPAVSRQVQQKAAQPQKTVIENKVVYPTITYNSDINNSTGGSRSDQWKKEQDAWWAEVQEENRQKAEQNNREYERFKADSEKSYQDAVNRGATSMQQFKDQYGIQ